MKRRYRLFKRHNGIFFIEDTISRKQESLRTRDKLAAERLLAARNEAYQQPALNLQLAKAYLAPSGESYVKRTWGNVMADYVAVKQGSSQERAKRAVLDPAYASISNLTLIETKPEHFLRVLEAGCVSTNVYLRRFHNFAMDLGWLPFPVLRGKQWPLIRYKERRPITREEFDLILSRETNTEMRSYLWCCWYLGGAQSDVAHLKAENVDWSAKVVSFFRAKTGSVQMIHFSEGLAQILQDLPGEGYLFPTLAAIDERRRAGRFQRACRRVKVKGVSLHSFRYAWAVRAREAGYPERFAQEALGHRSAAVHRYYAGKAKVKIPSLEDYEKAKAEGTKTIKTG